MIDKPGNISRRTFFRNMTAYAAGAAVVLNLVPGFAWAQTKMAQKIVKYQDMPKGEKICQKCVLFIAPNSCKMVDGAINPQGWCSLYSPK